MTTSPELSALIADLDSSDMLVREKAKGKIRQVGAEAVEPLIDVLQSNTIRASWEAARLLAAINDPRWIVPMQSVLTSTHPLLGQAAVTALETVGEQVAPSLIDALPHCHRMVQLQILTALESMKAHEAVPAIVTFLQTCQTPELTCAAIQALGVLGDNSHVDLIRSYETHENHHVRERVTIALQRLSGQAVD